MGLHSVNMSLLPFLLLILLLLRDVRRGAANEEDHHHEESVENRDLQRKKPSMKYEPKGEDGDHDEHRGGVSHQLQHDKITKKRKNESLEDFIVRIFEGYQFNYRPRSESHSDATVVKVNMYVTTFSSFSIIEMDYSLNLLLTQRWRDKRLQFAGHSEKLSLAYKKNNLWIPDLFFRNAKDGHLHTITNPNYLIWLYPDGQIIFSQKLNVRLSCPMHLWKFPMDSQNCPIEISSFGYAMKDLEFQWLSKNHTKNVELSLHMLLNEFDSPAPKTSLCNASYDGTGEFSCIRAHFFLKRKFGFYLIYTYLPSILIVVISWVSFFIDFQAVPARISIGLLSVLSLITQSAATLQKLPRVSYIKALDVWLFTCLAFVVFSLLEFAIVNVLARRQQRCQFEDDMRRVFREELEEFHLIVSGKPGPKRQPGGRMGGGGGGSPKRNGLLEAAANYRSERRNSFASIARLYSLKAHRVDRFCLFAYPLLFILFNLIYWIYFNFVAWDEINPPH